MITRRRIYRISLPFLAVFLLSTATASAFGQGLPGLERELNAVLSRMPSIGGIFESEMPGITRPDAPLVFTPIFGGELRVRPIFIDFSGTLKNTETNEELSLLDDLGFVEQGILVETMARIKISRLSLRVHNDGYLRTFRGEPGRLDWPEWRVGADLDLIDTRPFRFGVNMDFYWDQPSFSAQTPAGVSVGIGSPRPATWGGHVLLNCGNPCAIRYTVEARGRLSLREGSRIDEVEAAAGLMTPEMVIGNVAIRGGYRRTWLKLEASSREVRIHWSGVFGELVFWY